ncbi:Isochorismate synthase MenF [Leucobacter soli]|uniref:Isochorismate synthase MenF n=1 Tax=Leucobacter soli TaxID=2812850 RepID=A0A916JVZ9_9MICO|nr:Isochorismate synthase MenF [Leucobacter soli]
MPWPADAAALARAIAAQTAASRAAPSGTMGPDATGAGAAGAGAAGGGSGTGGTDEDWSGAWCWLDDWGGRSVLGLASELRVAERGREREFLAELRDAGVVSERIATGGRSGDGVSTGATPTDGVFAEEGAPQGWVVALGYEFGQALLGIDAAPDDAEPAIALRLDTALVLDHVRGVAELRGPDEAALDAWVARFERQAGESARDDSAPAGSVPSRAVSAEIAVRADGNGVIDQPELQSQPELRTRPDGGGALRGGGARGPWRKTPAAYEAEVEACRAAIRDGEAYVLCLTDTAEVSAPNVDPLTLYLELREGARGRPARGGVIVAGGRALVSASPERFLSIDGRRIATHPIKGTRPRGATPEEDARLAQELRTDPKERAENLMIVDLMRNDLSRVCAPGTVATSGFLRVETHPHVHQLVSTVEGELLPSADAIDAIEACFPGGSMTGAPKRRAVEILRDLERGPRGLYSGCFGWLGVEAGRITEAELAMTIRSVEFRGIGTLAATARVGAGGGITIDSEPGREEAEKRLKAAPLLLRLRDRR